MHLFRSDPVVQPRRILFSRSIHVAVLDAGDIEFHLLALLHPWGEEERESARKARLAEPGSSERSIAQPGGVDPASPTARLLKLVRTTDGGRWYVDLAGHEGPVRLLGGSVRWRPDASAGDRYAQAFTLEREC